MRKKKLTAYNKQRMTLYEFVIIGFNYTASIGFVGSFALLSASSSKDSIGMHALWVFPLVGIFAGTAAWAFARLSEVHKSSNNGAAYIYVRSSFGRLAGCLILILRYGTLPLLITIQILFLIKGSFAPGYVGPDSVFKNSFTWAGHFADLVLDVIGVLIYGSASLVLVFGMKIFKYTNKYMSWIKWTVNFIIILAALYLAIKSPQLSYWTRSTANGGGNHFSWNGILTAFTVFFFYFAGFETYSTAGKNIENPNRNVKLGIMLIMLISIILYVVVGFLFFAAFNGNINTKDSHAFQQNMNIGVWTAINIKWLALAGAIITLVGQLAMKIQVAVLNSLYGGTSLQPLAREGYISDYFKKLGRDNLPIRASVLNLILVAGLCFILLFIPDIMVASGLFTDKQIAFALNVNALLAISSTIAIFVYAMVIMTFIKLSITKKIRTTLWEWVLMPITMLVMLFLFFYHYYQIISAVVKTPEVATITAVAIEVVFIAFLFVFALSLYFVYYRPKYFRRLKTNPEVQEKLDKDFLVIDDWVFVAINIKDQIEKYKTRNFSLYGSHGNVHYKYASSVQEMLSSASEEYETILADIKAHEDDHQDE